MGSYDDSSTKTGHCLSSFVCIIKLLIIENVYKNNFCVFFSCLEVQQTLVAIIVAIFGLGSVVILIMACVCCRAQLKCHRKDTKMAKEGVACKNGYEANFIRMEVGCNVACRSGDEVTSMIGNVKCKSGDEADPVKMKLGDNIAYKSGDEVTSMIGNAVNHKSGDEASSVKMKSTTHDTKASVKMQDNMAYLTFM